MNKSGETSKRLKNVSGMYLISLLTTTPFVHICVSIKNTTINSGADGVACGGIVSLWGGGWELALLQ